MIFVLLKLNLPYYCLGYTILVLVKKKYTHIKIYKFLNLLSITEMPLRHNNNMVLKFCGNRKDMPGIIPTLPLVLALVLNNDFVHNTFKLV